MNNKMIADRNVWVDDGSDPAPFTLTGRIVYQILYALRSRYMYPRFAGLETFLISTLSEEQQRTVGWYLVDNFTTQYSMETTCSR